MGHHVHNDYISTDAHNHDNPNEPAIKHGPGTPWNNKHKCKALAVAKIKVLYGKCKILKRLKIQTFNMILKTYIVVVVHLMEQSGEVMML